MNPLNDFGIIGFGICPSCGGSSCDKCKCKNNSCGCSEPIFGIDQVQDTAATYRINNNGKTVTWNLQPGIQDAQTDTSLIVDIVNRLLKFSAERHTDSISASQLGSILHLNDLGDVSTKGAEDGSIMVYRKTDNCGGGCFGVNNIWEPWNALDGQTSSMAYVAGYDSDGGPASLQQPANPSQYYNVCWNKDKQVSYAQTVEASDFRLDADGYYYMECVDPNTREPYFVKRKP